MIAVSLSIYKLGYLRNKVSSDSSKPMSRITPHLSCSFFAAHINGLVQDCSNSSALAMELLQSCAKPSTLTQAAGRLRAYNETPALYEQDEVVDWYVDKIVDFTTCFFNNNYETFLSIGSTADSQSEAMFQNYY